LQDRLLAAGDADYRRIQLLVVNRLKPGAQNGGQFSTGPARISAGRRVQKREDEIRKRARPD